RNRERIWHMQKHQTDVAHGCTPRGDTPKAPAELLLVCDLLTAAANKRLREGADDVALVAVCTALQAEEIREHAEEIRSYWAQISRYVERGQAVRLRERLSVRRPVGFHVRPRARAHAPRRRSTHGRRAGCRSPGREPDPAPVADPRRLRGGARRRGR